MSSLLSVVKYFHEVIEDLRSVEKLLSIETSLIDHPKEFKLSIHATLLLWLIH